MPIQVLNRVHFNLVAGWPDLTNTGVPSGTSLTPHSGNYDTTSGGSFGNPVIIQNMNITGALVVNHTHLVFNRCRVTAPTSEIAAVFIAGTATGGAIDFNDCEFDGSNKSGGSGIFYDTNSNPPVVTLTRCQVRNVENGIGCLSHFRMYDSIVYDLDPAGADPHTDGVQTGAGVSDVIISHNTFMMDGPNTGPNNSCIQFNTTTTDNNGWLVEDNLLLLDPTTGGACVRIPLGDASANDLYVINNRMTPGVFNYRIPGPPDSAENHITQWSGNVNHDTGAVIP